MAITRFARFQVEPTDAEEMLSTRAALISAVRATYPGLTEARLTRVDDGTWIDVWRWESAASMDRALAGAHGLAEAPAAFALTRDFTSESAEIVDER